jgi:hypothetical protein
MAKEAEPAVLYDLLRDDPSWISEGTEDGKILTNTQHRPPAAHSEESFHQPTKKTRFG